MGKKLNLAVLIIPFLLHSCKKDQIANIDPKFLLDLTKYSLNKRAVNDSIIEYFGENKDFFIQGKYNNKLQHKTGWWSISRKNKEMYTKIQIFLEGDKEKNNQILRFNQNKIDTAKSKFYNLSFEYKNGRISKAKYDFYTPKSAYHTEYADLYYDIYIGKKSVESKKIKLKIVNDFHHSYEIDLSKYENQRNIFIGGLFVEYSFNDKKEEMGINEIFLEDSLKQ
ncbi:hypothetical protein [Chryseobacterium sediminis]|uniref:Uncharacterized protein n=1 Tax=Chryseobacterium sediminis TaxID=1679494 RepID=A0A5B2U3R6_9FLAO|nr:hypothetical protein [Chryseobacterium sediminis]KAA2220668.1 hypothetical protein FW780_17495 [Chryseobacterium sediminis]